MDPNENGLHFKAQTSIGVNNVLGGLSCHSHGPLATNSSLAHPRLGAVPGQNFVAQLLIEFGSS